MMRSPPVSNEEQQTSKSVPFAPLVPRPVEGRTFVGSRRVRLSDADASGRLRLDAVARYLQDVATDDVIETGWGAPDHGWLVRRAVVQVLAPFAIEEIVELVTWSSGVGASSAARRTSLEGGRGGRAEAEMIWVHLGRDGRPARFADDDSFDIYRSSSAGRRISPRLELSDPPERSERIPWPLRMSDLDVLGHVNNTAYWHGVEEVLERSGASLTGPLEAVLEFRQPLDLGDEVELRFVREASVLRLAFVAGSAARAVGEIRFAPA
jgi:acyl-ACP thioesterase